ncbi:MAG: tRNA (adenosine(37)-N6)-threonylcarbamoyltransferase complex dimerization subunit type 1 TsaB [Nitrospiraceae bacterium]|nr:tRNA (adenosine(37)-N6)-threonylcarbamoyltransferase complex dimerization subunit type 1 TsaB [Nitrospiraceae bacterium]MSR23553.1 tRNA (adenosine(37)-N6)-threonylcarbamoyltransferase complex dimerization subunit type 1 TsaB [Nitrospiraceae bacterium]
MRILAVETATSWQSVAIVEGDAVVARLDEDAAGSHARRLVPAIDRLLASCGMALTDMEGLAVSIGPGSFTGLRVGLATMLGFRLVTGLPLATVPTLEAMAWNFRRAEQLLCPMLRARTGEVYWAQYQWLPAGSLKQVQEEQVGTLEALVQSLKCPALMFGDGWELHKQDIRRLLGRPLLDAGETPPGAMRPSAVSVGRAGAERLRCGEVAGQGLSPRYVQRAEAEVVWERRGAVSPMTKAARQPGRRKARAS